MAEIVTLTGAPKRTTPPTRPKARLSTCPIYAATRDGLVPVNNCLISLEAETRRLYSMLGGDRAELVDRVEEIVERVIGFGGCGND